MKSVEKVRLGSVTRQPTFFFLYRGPLRRAQLKVLPLSKNDAGVFLIVVWE